LDIFPPDLGAVSDEHGERFHQDMSSMEIRYTGKRSQNLVADYCWNRMEEVPIANCREMTYRKTFEVVTELVS
jgi:hypothetical protein